MVSSVKNRITKWKILFYFLKIFVVVFSSAALLLLKQMCQSVHIIEKKERKRMKTKDLHQWDNLNVYGKSDTKCEPRELNVIEYIRYFIDL